MKGVVSAIISSLMVVLGLVIHQDDAAYAASRRVFLNRGILGTPGEPMPGPTQTPGAAAPGRSWVWPLAPQPHVVRSFDAPEMPWGSGHRGVDLLGRKAQQVRAAGAGTVTYAGVLAGRGVVTISHGELRTTYEPVTPTVTVGARVSAGASIGTLASTQSHCAPRTCLHWGLLRGDDYLDPLQLVRPVHPRLLPLGGSGVPGRDPRPWVYVRPHVATPSHRQEGDARLTRGQGQPTPIPRQSTPSDRRRDHLLDGVAAPAVGAIGGAAAVGLVLWLGGRSRGRPRAP